MQRLTLKHLLIKKHTQKTPSNTIYISKLVLWGKLLLWCIGCNALLLYLISLLPFLIFQPWSLGLMHPSCSFASWLLKVVLRKNHSNNMCTPSYCLLSSEKGPELETWQVYTPESGKVDQSFPTDAISFKSL